MEEARQSEGMRRTGNWNRTEVEEDCGDWDGEE